MSHARARRDLTGSDLQAAITAMSADGYTLIDLSGCFDGAGVRYAALWDRVSGPARRAQFGVPAAQYQQLFNQMFADGFRPIRLSGFATPWGTEFAGIWIADGITEWTAHHGLDANALEDRIAQLADNHYHLIDIAAWEEQGQARFAGIWQRFPGERPEVRINLDRGQHQVSVARMIRDRFVPVKIVGYGLQGIGRYAAIWNHRPSNGWQARHDLMAHELDFWLETLHYQGYTPVQASGYLTTDGVRYTCAWDGHYFHAVLAAIDDVIQQYCVRYTVPGLSLAISRQGRLIYARAFGFAHLWPLTPLRVWHRMRIASVSKPITATAIMLLQQRGQLSETQRLFGANALYGFSLAPAPYDANEVAIEVRHFLNHTSGFDANPTDPADEPAPVDARSLIGWTLNNRAPVAAPGTAFVYLNFGYVALGHVIETVTGQSYEQFVRNEVLAPAGITSMIIGGDNFAARQSDEVTYYQGAGDSDDPYAVRISRNAGTTGWIATPIDLLRFLRVVDGVGTDILTAASRASMSWPTAANPTYGYGWDISGTPGTWTHTGALAGSLALLRLTADGDGFAAIGNSRQPGMQQTAMLADLTTALDVIRAILLPSPSFDLFE